VLLAGLVAYSSARFCARSATSATSIGPPPEAPAAISSMFSAVRASPFA
jgi:hypothetical protein